MVTLADSILLVNYSLELTRNYPWCVWTCFLTCYSPLDFLEKSWSSYGETSQKVIYSGTNSVGMASTVL